MTMLKRLWRWLRGLLGPRSETVRWRDEWDSRK
jgi:hypothetical protein